MYLRNKLFFLISIILALAGCNGKQPAGQNNQQTDEQYKVYYAKGFQVKKYKDYTEVTVRDPWNTDRILQTYILVPKAKDVPDNLPKGTLIRTPLNSVAAYSTIHCSTLNELEVVDIIKGVCEPHYIALESIKEGVKHGSITNLGTAASPDIEKLMLLSPEAIFAAPIVGQSYGNIEKTKIPMIETPDYTEPDPLGRAEWLRFYSLFIDKEQLADSLFAVTESNYNAIKKIVAEATKHPTVFTDTRYMNSWDMPGGKSYMANMLADAGADYVWADDQSTTFMPLSFEAVLDKAGEADIWIIKYNKATDITYQSLEKEYKPYSYFSAFKNRNIWGCNTMYSNYYEDLPIHPDYILKDLAAVFHPQLFPDYTSRYYKRL